jgi:phage-related protein
MRSIGARCHEIRITDENQIWRIIYRIDSDAIVILEIFTKKTAQTPLHVIEVCKRRLKLYDAI